MHVLCPSGDQGLFIERPVDSMTSSFIFPTAQCSLGLLGKKYLSNAGDGKQGSYKKGAYTLNFLLFLYNYITFFTITIASDIHNVVSSSN